MKEKDTAALSDLLFITDLLAASAITYWLDGGWGVDVLTGRETRPHRDIDIDYDASQTELLLSVLEKAGFVPDTDQMPVRLELYSAQHGYLDIHPFEQEGAGWKQADPEGGWYHFPPEYFGSAAFLGRTIPCISPLGQKVFHEGYPLRDKDRHDIPLIEALL